MIRPVARYVESAVIEAQILEKVQRLDLLGVSRCVHIVDHFSFMHHKDKHYALIFEPLGKSLYDVMKANGYRGKTGGSRDWQGFRSRSCGPSPRSCSSRSPSSTASGSLTPTSR